jgi:hypothetical protein
MGQAVHSRAVLTTPHLSMPATVVVTGYLTEVKLGAALKAIIGPEWGGTQLGVPGSRRRWDSWFWRSGRQVVVEFDGDEHYRSTLKIKADAEKDAAAIEQGVEVVRMPYWVQLDTTTLMHFFGLHATIEQDFPHGFITTRIFPASFCELGVARFARELQGLPAAVRAAVVQSLRDRAQEYGAKYVVPSNMASLLE